mgnify:CR=1 FL=1
MRTQSCLCRGGAPSGGLAMATDVRIFITIFITIGALADGCALSSGFASINLHSVAPPAILRPTGLLELHDLPARSGSSFPAQNMSEFPAHARVVRTSASERRSHRFVCTAQARRLATRRLALRAGRWRCFSTACPRSSARCTSSCTLRARLQTASKRLARAPRRASGHHADHGNLRRHVVVQPQGGARDKR